jgi:hypothetical protein
VARRRRYLPALVLLALAAAMAIFVATRGPSRSAAVADGDAAEANDGAVASDAPVPDAEHDAGAPVVADATVAIPGVDARAPLADGGPRRPVSDAGDPLAVPDAVATPDAAAPPAVLRKVTIGATPWANFTVDDDPTPHETPETIELAPGAHRIHFSNHQLGVTRTVTIDVPTDRDIKHVEALDAP